MANCTNGARCTHKAHSSWSCSWLKCRWGIHHLNISKHVHFTQYFLRWYIMNKILLEDSSRKTDDWRSHLLTQIKNGSLMLLVRVSSGISCSVSYPCSISNDILRKRYFTWFSHFRRIRVPWNFCSTSRLMLHKSYLFQTFLPGQQY